MSKNKNKIKDVDSLLEWEYDVINASYLSIVLFYSKKSEPSIRMINQLKEITENYDKAKFFSLDVDKHPTITWKFRVTILPTTMMFLNGQKLQEIITLKTNKEIMGNIEQYVQKK